MPQLTSQRFGSTPQGPDWREALRDGLRRDDALREVEAEQKQATEREREEDAELHFQTQLEYNALIPTGSGRALDLDLFPFQRELYSEEVLNAEEVAIRKATQIGVSEVMWRWAVRRVDDFGETIIYYFPTDNHITDFGDTRIEPAILASPYLSRRIPKEHVRQKKLKQIGAGTLYLRGLQSKTGVHSVDAEGIVFDEYDEADPKQIGLAEQRISGARERGMTPRIRRIGKPSIPGWGIDAEYENSDRRVWMVTCPKCEREQELEFTKTVRWRSEASGSKVLSPADDEFDDRRDITEVWRACESCEASLEQAVGAGRWQATMPGKYRPLGYHVSRLIVPTADLVKLVYDSRTRDATRLELFHQASLGLGWVATDAALTDEAIDRAMAFNTEMPQEGYSGRYPVTMGVDVHSEQDLYVRISELSPDGRRRAIRIAEASDFGEVCRLMDVYRVGMCVIDSMPERRIGRAVAKRFPGRVYLCSYNEKPLSDWKVDAQKHDVSVNRTEAIDAMMESIRTTANAPLQAAPAKYKDQLKSLKRKVIEDSKGRPQRVYVSTGSQGDHYGHAEVYDLVAAELLMALEQVSAERALGDERPLTEEELGITGERDWRRGGYYAGFQG